MEINRLSISFIVWKSYQRRVEVLAPLLNAEAKFISHLFSNRYLRPIDYLLKLLATIYHIFRYKPDLIIAQAPPLFSAIPATLRKVPYVIDAHNGVFQGMWGRLPLSKYLIENARAVIVHNSEILQLAKKLYPSVKFFNIPDPIERIPPASEERLEKQILIVCSFDSDEPIDVIIDLIQELTDFNFTITADIKKVSVEQRIRFLKCSNISWTGFLPTKEYQTILSSSLAALVLTSRDSTQPSGACEALSSDTQLIISQSTLTQKLFGKWAILVDNSVESIARAIRSLESNSVDLSLHRSAWNMSVQQEVLKLNKYIENIYLTKGEQL